MAAFFTVLMKVMIMLIMISAGWALSKIKFLSEQGIKDISNVLVYVVAPCLTISSFANADTKSVTPANLLLSLICAVIAMGLAVIISYFFCRKSPDEEKVVIRFSIVFSNCGFMGLPLVQSIIGNEAVVYCTMFIGVFNLLTWTYGYAMMSSSNAGLGATIKKAIINPGIIGIVIGLSLFFIRLKTNFVLPEVIESPITFFGNMNTPLAMLVVGNNIFKVAFKDIFTDKRVYFGSAIRLVLVPAITIPLLCLMPANHDIILTCVLQACAPVAANAVIFSVMFDRDSKLASKLVAASTILSLVTIPFFVMVAEFLMKII